MAVHGLVMKHQQKKAITPYLDTISGWKPDVFVVLTGWKQRYRPKYFSATNDRCIYGDVFFIDRIAHQNNDF